MQKSLKKIHNTKRKRRLKKQQARLLSKLNFFNPATWGVNSYWYGVHGTIATPSTPINWSRVNPNFTAHANAPQNQAPPLTFKNLQDAVEAMIRSYNGTIRMAKIHPISSSGFHHASPEVLSVVIALVKGLGGKVALTNDLIANLKLVDDDVLLCDEDYATGEFKLVVGNPRDQALRDKPFLQLNGKALQSSPEPDVTLELILAALIAREKKQEGRVNIKINRAALRDEIGTEIEIDTESEDDYIYIKVRKP